MTDTPPESVNATMIFDSERNGVDGEMRAQHEEVVGKLMALGNNAWERGLIFAALTQGFVIGSESACQVFASMHPELDGEQIRIDVPFTYQIPEDAEKIGSADADGDEDSHS